MATAPKRAKGRSIADFPNLTAAEKKLLKACREGQIAKFGEERPIKSAGANTIRPSLIRFLMLGGDNANSVHESGVQLRGAWIVEAEHPSLDLEGINSRFPLHIFDSALPGTLIFRRACLPFITMEGSAFSGLQADGLHCKSSLLLRSVVCEGEARIVGGKIDGTFECNGGSFRSSSGRALICDRVKIAGDVFLSKGFNSLGEVRLVSAEIGGSLECSGGSFRNNGAVALNCDSATIGGSANLRTNFHAEGETRLLCATIGGNLGCDGAEFLNENATAFNCDRATVNAAFFWRKVAAVKGGVDFSAMKAGLFIDDPENTADGYFLDGFSYDRFAGDAPTNAEWRCIWLNRQWPRHLKDDFRPQPWEQVIKVLREMGHEGEARKVAIAKQEQMRVANKVGDFPLRLLHWLYGFFAGYGYEPLRAVSALVVLWLCGALAFQIVESYGIMGPTSPIINSSKIAEECSPPKGNLESTWTTCSAIPKEYTTFSAFWYSADLILPLVNLQQEADWAPIVARSELEKDGTLDYIPLGVFARLLMWFEILFGWAASLLLVAVLGNLVKKD